MKIYIRAAPRYEQGRQYLSLQQAKMDFSVRDIRMGVENVHDGNTVLRKCIKETGIRFVLAVVFECNRIWCSRTSMQL